jgi:hypothetical protein
VRIDGELPFRGEVVWLTPEQGGRSTGPPPTPSMQDYAATAYVPPASGSGALASFVLRIADRTAWRSAATAGWLVAENAGQQSVEPGSVVVVTEGLRPVAYFHVAQVAPS